MVIKYKKKNVNLKAAQLLIKDRTPVSVPHRCDCIQAKALLVNCQSKAVHLPHERQAVRHGRIISGVCPVVL